MSDPLFPEIEVKLVGQDGNAYNLMGLVSSALKKAGHHKEAKEFLVDATSGDYNHLLRTCSKYVEVY